MVSADSSHDDILQIQFLIEQLAIVDDSLQSSAPPSKSSTALSGPDSEEEIRAILMDKTPVTVSDLVCKFKGRLTSSEDRQAFIELMKRVSKIRETANGFRYLILKEK